MYPKDKLKLSPNVPKEWEEKTRKELQGYYGHCSASDKAIGSILDKIKELNLKENTTIVLLYQVFFAVMASRLLLF